MRGGENTSSHNLTRKLLHTERSNKTPCRVGLLSNRASPCSDSSTWRNVLTGATIQLSQKEAHKARSTRRTPLKRTIQKTKTCTNNNKPCSSARPFNNSDTTFHYICLVRIKQNIWTKLHVLLLVKQVANLPVSWSYDPSSSLESDKLWSLVFVFISTTNKKNYPKESKNGQAAYMERA